MPRNSAGVYTLPPTNPVVPFTTIATSWANPTLSDIGNELTNSLDRTGRGGMLAPFRIFDGTLSQPGLGFQNEVGLGLWRSGTGVMNLTSSGVNLLTINGSAAISPVKLEHRGLDTFKLTGQKNWKQANEAGQLVFTPSATADAEDWDTTKSIKFLNDGSISFTNATVINNYGRASFISDTTPQVDLGSLDPNKRITLAYDGTANTGTIALENGYSIAPLNFRVNGGQVMTLTPDKKMGLGRAYGSLIASSKLEIAGGNVNIQDANGDPYRSFCFQGNSVVTIDTVSVPYYGLTMANFPTYGNYAVAVTSFGKIVIAASGGIVSAVFDNIGPSAKCFTPVPAVATVGGGTNLDYNLGQSQVWTLSSPLTMNVINLPVGALARVVLIGTDQGVTIGGVVWPNGEVPDFSSGPLKKSVIAFTNDGAAILGNAAIY